MTIKVLLFSHDPGGANTIIPLVAPLASKGYEVLLYGKGSALLKYKQAKLPQNEMTETVEDFLKKNNPNFVITGTSANDMSEKLIWKECQRKGIPCFAILDQWLNYGIRFSNYGLDEISKYLSDKVHPHLPTKIIVMDEFAKQEAIAEGLPLEKISVCGQPYFESVFNFKPQLTKEDLGFDENDFIITFASEPITKVYKENSNILGYTEKSILQEVTNALETLTTPYTFVVKLHPKEDIADFKNCNFKLDTTTPPQELIYHSNLVIGMSSMFLIEAALMNKPVLSVQIGLKTEDQFILSKRGMLKTILDPKKLKEELQYKNLNCHLEVIKNPVERIIKLMEEVLTIK